MTTLIGIKKSTRKDKKFMAIFGPDGKKVHFGAKGYEDYTIHHDDIRRGRTGMTLQRQDPYHDTCYGIRILSEQVLRTIKKGSSYRVYLAPLMSFKSWFKSGRADECNWNMQPPLYINVILAVMGASKASQFQVIKAVFTYTSFVTREIL